MEQEQSMKPFVHLHLHSQYSMLEACCRIQETLKKVKDFEMPALALTDNGNMFGAIEFYLAAKKMKIKPILGFDAYLAPKDRFTKNEKRGFGYQPNTRIVLLAQNHNGYRNLCKLSSIGYQEGFYYKPRIDLQSLKEHSEGIIALTGGGSSGDLIYHQIQYGEQAARKRFIELRDIFGDRLYIEVHRTGTQDSKEVEAFLFDLGQRESVPLVAANEIYYLNREDELARRVLVCVGTNRTLHDENNKNSENGEHYLKSPDQMYELFQDCPELCERTVEVSERCHVEFHFKDESGKSIYHLPGFPTKNNISVLEELKRLTKKGLKERFEESKKKKEEISPSKHQEYLDRLEYEISVIDGMGFVGYFLIVQDFINWAKKENIPVGPGRGSGAGSLVAYCLRITDLDPVRYNLIFERFLNPERISMPDFDIDFCQERRSEVIEYVTQKYGKHSVSQIITYGRLQARAALRDVGRVLGINYSEVDGIAKLVPDRLGITLEKAIKMESRIRDQMEASQQVQNMIDIALKVEGLVRHAGIHAAGVIIADGELVNHAPLYKGVDGENVVQYDMKHAEKIGLIKFDFLGLKTLTYIQYALELIEENHGTKIQAHEIDINDPKIYELMSSGDSAGIFQFEGDGITNALKRIKPTCFEDIMAINALYRPGPMDMIPEYTKRKHGKSKVEYIFPELEDILKETHGVIVYQEQVQWIASKIASYSLGEADILRRAMGKKISSEMDQQRQRFLEGAKSNGYDKDSSEKLFDLMAEFAKYGFNKSHSAAYCVIAAQTAWLKARYSREFYAAVLSTEMGDTEKIVKYIKLCQLGGIEVHPPHINHSGYKFTVKGDTIYYGLAACKGVGQSAAEAIIDCRSKTKNQKYESLDHFFEALDLRRINKKVIESLIKAGALDGFGYHRRQIFEGFEKFVGAAETRRQDQEVGQSSLFSLNGEQEMEKATLQECEPWKRMEKLVYEKEVLGFFLSDHPLKGYKDSCRLWSNANVSDLIRCKNGKKVTLVGMISKIREIVTKKGSRMAFFQFEDLTGTVEVVVFPEVYTNFETLLKRSNNKIENGKAIPSNLEGLLKQRQEEPLIVTGLLERKNESCKIIADKITILSDGIEKAKCITFRVPSKMEKNMEQFRQKLTELRETIDKNPGQTQVRIQMNLNSLNKEIIFDMDDLKGIQLSNNVLEALQHDFGEMKIHLEPRSVDG